MSVETIDHFARLTKANKKWLQKAKTKDKSMNDILNALIEKERKKKEKKK